MELYEEMYDCGILEVADVQLAKAWIEDLKAVGYQFPSAHVIKEFELQPIQSPGILPIHIPMRYTENKPLVCKHLSVRSYPRHRLSGSIDSSSSNGTVLLLNVSEVEIGSPVQLRLSCWAADGSVRDYRFKEPLFPMPIFEDILLIIHFNHGQEYHLVNELTRVYNQSFPNYIVVGTDQPKSPFDEVIQYWPMMRHGWAMPRSIKYAAEMRPGYRGYLLVNNDAAIRYWKWAGRNKDRVWLTEVQCRANYTLPLTDPIWRTWHWWAQIRYQFLNNLFAQFSEEEMESAFSVCGPDMTFWCGSDVFYVPSTIQDKYIHLLSYLNDTQMGHLFEVAVPMLLSAASPYQEWEKMNMLYCWDGDDEGEKLKRCPHRFIEDESLDVVHPWKINHPQLGNYTQAFDRLPSKKFWIKA